MTGEGRQAEELLRIRYASDSDPHWAFGLVRSYESNLQSQEDAKEIASLKKWARKRSMSAIYRVKRTGLVEDSSDFRFADELHKRNQ